MANLPLAFGELLAGSVLVISAVTDRSIGETIKGVTEPAPGAASIIKGGGGSTGSESGSGTAGATMLAGNVKGGASPVPHSAIIGRTDQGVDFSTKPGTPILAPGKAKILGIQQNWYKGQPFLWYEVIEGPLKGMIMYVAEQIVPKVKPGDIVSRGQQIATYAGSGTGGEAGFATKTGQTLAAATTGYTEGQETTAGKAFKELLSRFGL